MKIHKTDWGRLYNEDCLKTLSNVKDDSIDFILTDPPYYIANEVTLIRRSNKMKYKGKDLYLDEKWDQQWENRDEYKEWFLISYLSKAGDVVLDPFAGSGTFLVSSALLGRKYIGVEKEEKYIDWINYRLNNLKDVYPLLKKFVNKVLEKKNRNTSMGEILDILGKPERLISIPRMLF